MSDETQTNITLNCVALDPTKSYLCVLRVPKYEMLSGIWSEQSLARVTSVFRDKGMNVCVLAIPDDTDLQVIEQEEVRQIVKDVLHEQYLLSRRPGSIQPVKDLL